MKTMLAVIAAWLVLLAVTLGSAHACTIAPDRLTGGYWIQYYQGGAGGTLSQWGDSSTPAVQLQVINKTCNDLQSTGSVSGGIHWFNTLTTSYSVGDGPWGWRRCGYISCFYTNPSSWTNPNEGAVFYWNDGTQWDRAVNCSATGQYLIGSSVRAQWTCTHQQSRDNGASWAGTSQMVLQPAL